MAKKQKSKLPVEATQAPEAVQEPIAVTPKERKPLSIYDFKVQAIIVALLAFIFYINTYSNEFAHDDGIVIVKNEYVQEGFAGIPNILSKDAYASYYRQLNTSNQLSGGRYRPLSIVTFAVEQQFFGAVPLDKIDSFLQQNLSYGIHGATEKKLINDMHIRHVFNVFWYMLGVVVLLYFLRYIIFKGHNMMAFVAAILFTIHPIHTEVVANVKSRDEIMSLLFVCLTFILAFKYEEYKKVKLPAPKINPFIYLFGALFSFFLAFLAKEYAITLVVLLPLSFYLFNDYTPAKSIKVCLPYLVVLGLYLFIRIKVATQGVQIDSIVDLKDALTSSGSNSDKEILNNPYYYATHSQKIATEIASSVYYLKLLIFPQPLSADYSYNSIPYKSFGDWQVWLSIIVHLGIIGATAFFTFFKKQYKIFAFACAFYILHLILVNNLVFNIGATLGERLIYHSSVGFAIVMAWLMVKGAEKLHPVTVGRGALAGVLTVIILLCGYKTISRNRDWKNDKTLFMEDIKVVPNSVLVNGNVAASYITMSDVEKNDTLKKQYIHTAIRLLDKAIAIHARPAFVAGYLNQGIAFYKLGMMDSAKACLDSVKANYPNYPTLRNLYVLLGDYYNRDGWNRFGKFGKFAEAIEVFKQGLAIDSTSSELWYNLGGAYFSNKQYPEAVQAWQTSLQLNPKNPPAQQGMQAALGILNSMGKLPPQYQQPKQQAK